MEQRMIDADVLKVLMMADSLQMMLFGKKYELSDALKTVNNAPTVDAVPVIRCRDCKYTYYSDNFGITAPWLMCKRHIGNCYRVSENDFCSFAERKEE